MKNRVFSSIIFLFILIIGCKTTEVKDDKPYFGEFNKIEPDMTNSIISDKNWYKDAIFYHIWVKAFNDSDGDGIGDIKGIIQKLDYLNDNNPATKDDLGITAIWLSPIFECDYKAENMHGYDTVDYYKINSKFGTEEDVIQLLKEAHKRGIRIIFDYVVNHTSDKHPWFLDSKENGPKRDWYIWNKMPQKKGDKKIWTKPWDTKGNWGQVWHKYNDSYYYGAFWRGMPDLNLKNREVRKAMADVLVYWLNRGFDGIRIDAARYIEEDGPQQAADTPGTHRFFKNLRRDILDRYDAFNVSKMMVAEAWTDANKIAPYYGNGNDEFHMCFDFPYAYAILDAVKNGSKSTQKIINFDKSLSFFDNLYPQGSQAGTFLSNHDEVASRPMTAYGLDKKKTILAFALNIFAKGTPFVYFGNEIGMEDAKVKGDMRFRTPFDWDKVSQQQKDTDSILNWHKRLIDLKKSYRSLRYGNYKRVKCSDDKTLAFIRNYENETLLIVVNFNDQKKDISLDFSDIETINNSKIIPILGNTEKDDKEINESIIKSFKIFDIEATGFKVYKIEK